MSKTEMMHDMLIDARELLFEINKEYGLSDNWEGNGCEHGFKPAKNCPNKDCKTRNMQLVYEYVVTF